MSDVVYVFSGWAPLVRILLIGTAMYIALVALLRISGSRTLSTMNIFDFIITIAIGSAFGRVLTAKSVALTEAVTAFALLILLQFVVAWLQMRWAPFKRLVTNPPVLLYFKGEFQQRALRQNRITEAEVRGAIRKRRIGSLREVEAVILEASGDLSIIRTLGDGSAFGTEIREPDDKEPGAG
jgi:uncharacterized membrane protein YcaP (DUF421 family)